MKNLYELISENGNYDQLEDQYIKILRELTESGVSGGKIGIRILTDLSEIYYSHEASECFSQAEYYNLPNHNYTVQWLNWNQFDQDYIESEFDDNLDFLRDSFCQCLKSYTKIN